MTVLRQIVWGLFVFVIGACPGDAGSEGAEIVVVCPGDAGLEGSEAIGACPGDAGSEGSEAVGAPQCQQDSECLERADDELRRLVVPMQVPRAPRFERGVCIHLSVIADSSSVSGPACECQQAGSGSISIGPAGGGCYEHGRVGDCLFSDEEFSYCELDDTTLCSSLCEELEARYEADAARRHDGEVKHATCDEGACHNVLEIDGHCYADRSYQNGRIYDCSLDGEEILNQHTQSSTKPAGEIVNTPSFYVAEAEGTVGLAVATQFIGTKQLSLYFGTSAQLYRASGSNEQRADVIDPLEGIDDCGVRRDHAVGSALAIEWRNVESAVLIDQGEEYSYELQLGSSRTFFNYGIDLTAQGVAPRFRGKYGFRAVGGSFGNELSVDGIELPEPLSIRELASAAHVTRGPLHLTWTGRNDQPLRLLVYISPQPLSDITYELECLMKDDGAFEIPDQVMQAVPDGIAKMQFSRAKRRLLRDQDRAILAIASINVTHELAYGDRCERASVIDACQRYAEQMQKVYSDCGRPVPDLDELCPDYLTEACTVCPEYYECMLRANTCEGNQLTFRTGCSCPK